MMNFFFPGASTGTVLAVSDAACALPSSPAAAPADLNDNDPRNQYMDMDQVVDMSRLLDADGGIFIF